MLEGLLYLVYMILLHTVRVNENLWGGKQFGKMSDLSTYYVRSFPTT